MKRSQSSSASSSSSSSVGFGSNDQIRPKRQRRNGKTAQKCDDQKANSPSNGRRSSIYRGVTKHRWTGRFEAHLWDKSSWNNVQNKKGRQVYLGAYDTEEAAARTYDLAALKYWGPNTILNFSIENYEKELEEMQKVSKEEYLSSLRRQSSGFARGVSKYRGVARHHHNGRWEARIGRVYGNKYLYLGTYNTQEEAAMAYDLAAIEYRGLNAVTNFDISKYVDQIKKKPERAQTETKIEAQEISNSCNSEGAEVDRKSQPQQQQQEVDRKVQLQLQPQQQQQQKQSDSSDILVSGESSLMTGIDPLIEQDFQWGFMDNGLPPLEFSSSPFEETWDLVLDMFVNENFEEDVDLMFKTDPNENEVGLNAIMDGPESNGDDKMGVPTSMENNGQEKLICCSSSSSPTSSTASVSCK